MAPTQPDFGRKVYLNPNKIDWGGGGRAREMLIGWVVVEPVSGPDGEDIQPAANEHSACEDGYEPQLSIIGMWGGGGRLRTRARSANGRVMERESATDVEDISPPSSTSRAASEPVWRGRATKCRRHLLLLLLLYCRVRLTVA